MRFTVFILGFFMWNASSFGQEPGLDKDFEKQLIQLKSMKNHEILVKGLKGTAQSILYTDIALLIKYFSLSEIDENEHFFNVILKAKNQEKNDYFEVNVFLPISKLNSRKNNIELYVLDGLITFKQVDEVQKLDTTNTTNKSEHPTKSANAKKQTSYVSSSIKMAGMFFGLCSLVAFGAWAILEKTSYFEVPCPVFDENTFNAVRAVNWNLWKRS